MELVAQGVLAVLALQVPPASPVPPDWSVRQEPLVLQDLLLDLMVAQVLLAASEPQERQAPRVVLVKPAGAKPEISAN